MFIDSRNLESEGKMCGVGGGRVFVEDGVHESVKESRVSELETVDVGGYELRP